MSKRWILALGALALCISTAVWGDYNVLDKGSYSQNATNGSKVNASGVLLTSETADLGTQTSGFLTLASGGTSDTTAVGVADSCAVQTAYAGYVLHGIYIRASLPSGGASATNAFCRVALSIRTHVGGLADSVNTHPVLFGRQSVSRDSLTFGNVTAPTSVQWDDSEIIITLTREDQNASKWSQGYGRYIPLEDAAGQGLRLPNFSVRWRVLSATANTNAFAITAYATVLR